MFYFKNQMYLYKMSLKFFLFILTFNEAKNNKFYDYINVQTISNIIIVKL